MGVQHTDTADKERQEVMREPHTGSADKERQELIRPSRTGRTQSVESHFVQTRDVLTKVVFRHTVRRIRFVQNSRLQKHSQWNLISSNQGYVGSSRLQTQSVEGEQLRPGVY